MNTHTNKTIKQSASKIWKSCNAVLKSHQDKNTAEKSDDPKPSTSQKKKSDDNDSEGESETMTDGDHSPKKSNDDGDAMADADGSSKDVENGSTTKDVEMKDVNEVDKLVTSGTGGGDANPSES